MTARSAAIHRHHHLDQPAMQSAGNSAAIVASAAARTSSASGSKAYQRSWPQCVSITRPNSTYSANQTNKFSTTPTTAAVIAASAPAKLLLPRSCSMNGASAKIYSIAGTNGVKMCTTLQSR